MNNNCIECGLPLVMPDAIGYHPACAKKVFERENIIPKILCHDSVPKIFWSILIQKTSGGSGDENS